MAVNIPKWEMGGTFNEAVKGTKSMMEDPRHGSVLKDICWKILDCLRFAHVATLDIDQFNALPRELDDLGGFTADPHLPFNPIYISVEDPMFGGLLLASDITGDMGAVGFWDMESSDGRFSIYGSTRITLPVSMINLTKWYYVDIAEMMIQSDNVNEYLSHDMPDLIDDPDAIFTATRMTLDTTKVIRFLQSSNVDLGDTPISRQVRRNARRKGYQISSRVYVRSPRRPTQTIGPGEHIDFSHRFEVRGHYKHFGVDTRLFKATKRDQPHKIINHPTRGEVVRVWCPNFVKGPEDKPLVPKTRVYKEFEKKE